METILRISELILSPQVVAGLIIIIALTTFKEDIRGVLKRFARIKLPGGTELEMQQLNQSEYSTSKQMDLLSESENEFRKNMEAKIEENEQQIESIQKIAVSNFRESRLWEFRFLNYFLVYNSQRVLDWFNNCPEGITPSSFDSLWMGFIPSPDQRKAIIGALITTEDIIVITEKGKEFIQWRGPLENLFTFHKDKN